MILIYREMNDTNFLNKKNELSEIIIAENSLNGNNLIKIS